MYNAIDSQVLFIGIDFHNPRGGVASVENEYSRVFSPFKFVRTCVCGNKLSKALVAAQGVVKFTFKLLVDRRIRIVHVNAASDASFWRKRIFINIAKHFGKKIVYHNHGGCFKRFYSQHPREVEQTLAKADCIIALSQDWKNFFVNELGCRRVEIVNNPVAPPSLLPISSDESRHPLRLLFLGAIMQAKGIYDLLDVLADNRDKYEGKVELHVGGNGELDMFQKLIIEKQLSDLVKFEGWVDGDKKTQLLNQTDLFILPSYFEGLPISILEAMSYGKPIVSTEIGGIPEIVHNGENGILFTPGDKKALADAIDRLLENSALRISMGKKSLELVKPYYSSEVSSTLRKLYSSLLNQ